MEDIRRLFIIEKKNDLEKYCRNLTIKGSDFVELICACESIIFPYNHRSYAVDFHPDHLEPSKQERDAFKASGIGTLEGDAGKYIKKINQRFKDRRCFTGHIFHTNCQSRWHFFYFDQRDISGPESNWKQGSHVHLINHLWPQYTLSSILSNISEQKIRFNSSVHIRFDEPLIDAT